MESSWRAHEKSSQLDGWKPRWNWRIREWRRRRGGNKSQDVWCLLGEIAPERSQKMAFGIHTVGQQSTQRGHIDDDQEASGLQHSRKWLHGWADHAGQSGEEETLATGIQATTAVERLHKWSLYSCLNVREMNCHRYGRTFRKYKSKAVVYYFFSSGVRWSPVLPLKRLRDTLCWSTQGSLDEQAFQYSSHEQ